MGRPEIQVEKRFWAKVDKSGECWLWMGARLPRGYGVIRIDGKNTYAHRIAYQLSIGIIPTGLDLDHICRITSCVNPAHLEPVTRRENLLRGDTIPAKHAKKTHCQYGHKYSPNNTYRINGSRVCATCTSIRNHKDYLRRKYAQAD